MNHSARKAVVTALLLATVLAVLAACAGAASVLVADFPEPLAVEIPFLAEAFQDGTRLPAGDVTVTARTLAIGDLPLPTGEVIVADAFAGADTEPLAQRVSPGAYPVSLSLITYLDSPYEAIAAAKVRFAPGMPVTWHLATTPGQDTSTLAEDEFFGYPVDSGRAMFASPAGARLLGEKLFVFGVLNVAYLKAFSEQMEANAPNGGAWINRVLDTDDRTNVVAFQSGNGDGVYAAYWGYDAEGTLVVLVTEFGLVI